MQRRLAAYAGIGWAFNARLASMMAVAVGLAVLAGIAGLYLSYYADVAAGAAIAGLLVLAYLLARLLAIPSHARKLRRLP
jgi:ABC-type Mn2+/Zn2+ transport system permease subunit